MNNFIKSQVFYVSDFKGTSKQVLDLQNVEIEYVSPK